MIYVNKNIRKMRDMALVTDFDKTLTNCQSNSTIGVFSKYLNPDYVEKKKEISTLETQILRNSSLIIRRLELEQIWLMKLKLLSQYLTEEVIHDIVRTREFIFRDGAIDVLKYLTNHGITVIIDSSGVGELVRELLAYNGCDIRKISIFSNFILENQNYFITPENKTLLAIERIIDKKQQRILIGDTLGDLTMIKRKRKTDISIGFLDDEYEKYLEQFNENYDVVATENTPYDEPLRRIKIL